jgi:hypothetical protein
MNVVSLFGRLVVWLSAFTLLPLLSHEPDQIMKHWVPS